jgi:hypothetical protein
LNQEDRIAAVSPKSDQMADFKTPWGLLPLSKTILRKGVSMPTKVNVELIIVWACVGFFTGAGWAVATWLVGRILGLTHL